MLNRAKPKSRFCGFRLTDEEHDLLARTALFNHRKMADLVHLIVVEALEGYAQRFAEEEEKSRTHVDRSQR